MNSKLLAMIFTITLDTVCITDNIPPISAMTF